MPQDLPLDQDVARCVNAAGQGPFVLVCEHASRFVPPAFGTLGLDEAALRSHIAWDPGALEVAQHLARALDAPLVQGCVSRLVYDCNRPPEAASAMPERSEDIDIPGNHGLSQAQRAARTQGVYRPFEALLAKTLAARSAPVVVTMHSFTPVYLGQPRAVEIGVLHDADSRLADAMLGDPPPFDTRRNAPYGPEDGVTHTLRHHAAPRGLLNVMIEIRNDLIATPEACGAMADVLAPWLQQSLRALGGAPAKGEAAQ